MIRESAEDFAARMQEIFVMVHHPYGGLTRTREVDIACKDHGVILSWEECASEGNNLPISGLDSYLAMKKHMEKEHKFEAPRCACGAPARGAAMYAGEGALVYQCIRCITMDGRTYIGHRDIF